MNCVISSLVVRYDAGSIIPIHCTVKDRFESFTSCIVMWHHTLILTSRGMEWEWPKILTESCPTPCTLSHNLMKAFYVLLPICHAVHVHSL